MKKTIGNGFGAWLMLLALISCQKPADQRLNNTAWELVSLSELTPEKLDDLQRRPTIAFSDSSTVAGYSGCNSYFGTFEREGNRIAITLTGSTLMLCPDMEVESAFYNAVPEIGVYEIEQDTVLTCYDKNGSVTARFRRIEQAESAKH